MATGVGAKAYLGKWADGGPYCLGRPSFIQWAINRRWMICNLTPYQKFNRKVHLRIQEIITDGHSSFLNLISYFGDVENPIM